MLDKVESKIKSSDFEHNARALIDEAKSKLATDGMMYVQAGTNMRLSF